METISKSGKRAIMQKWFSSGRVLRCLGVAIEHNLSKDIRDIKVCADFKMPKVKVSIIFSGI
jgi:hypothetical protein